jgi:GntR family transcriptional regulator/MocR family aminotransferase
MVIPPSLVSRFLAVRQSNDLCPSHLYQAALADFIGGGHFTRHIRKTRQLYADRRNALTQALRKEFGSEIEILGAEAGMHLVVTLPPGMSDQKISARAAEESLWLWPLSLAYAGPDVRQGFILGFGGTKAEEMPHQVRRMRKAMRGESGYRARTQSGH